VVLASHVVWVFTPGQFAYFHPGRCLVLPDELESGLLDAGDDVRVDLVPVTVALAHGILLAVQAVRDALCVCVC